MEVKDFNDIKEGDLVEILLKKEAEFFDGMCSRGFIVEDSGINIPGRYVSGYVASINLDEEYFVMHPTWNKEKAKIASSSELCGWRMYSNAVESFSKK
ncbi:Uncharacterised protein [uncultured archaeon]|nr:Uncharacterised protein [uncultured archaeon]